MHSNSVQEELGMYKYRRAAKLAHEPAIQTQNTTKQGHEENEITQ